ncbi:MAG: TIM barrel protein [Gammaproteobacteria bacterium]|nr:TIM barrel protein [Gammaproteobacteria bacterium]
MPKFSANLGFLWRELPLPQAIRAAAAAGFGAVECCWPYDADVDEVNAALNETGLRMLGLNTRPGINGEADFGVNALPGREEEARSYIDEAIAYATAVGCRNINLLAGRSGGGAAAEAAYRRNLAYASERAAPYGIGLLIEPINQRDAPGYHLRSLEQGLATLQAVGSRSLRLMFDCYHIQIMHGELTQRLRAALPYTGHIQIAAVPDRGEPDDGEIDYPALLAALDAMGWQGFIGAEYRPRSSTEAGLGWLDAYR